MDEPWVWAIIALVAVVLFGSKRLPDAAQGLGRSLRIFKAETKGLVTDDDPAVPAATAPAATAPVATAPVAVAPVYAAPVQQVLVAVPAPAEQPVAEYRNATT
jgi:sec-independent protein translocase protein TatA